MVDGRRRAHRETHAKLIQPDSHTPATSGCKKIPLPTSLLCVHGCATGFNKNLGLELCNPLVSTQAHRVIGPPNIGLLWGNFLTGPDDTVQLDKFVFGTFNPKADEKSK